MIDVKNENLIRFRDLPAWSKKHLGRRIHPSTFQRWRLRGVRGVKLETVLIGGERSSSDEAINRFIAAITAAADGETLVIESTAPDSKAIQKAEAFLASEGV